MAGGHQRDHRGRTGPGRARPGRRGAGLPLLRWDAAPVVIRGGPAGAPARWIDPAGATPLSQVRRLPGRSGAAARVPGSLGPRRADATEVIGVALLAKAQGRGWRRIAAELGRPPATVRRWLRAVSGPHVAWLRRRGVECAARVHSPVLVDLDAQPTELGDALAAFAAAVVAWRYRFARHAGAWTLINVFAGGRLLTPL